MTLDPAILLVAVLVLGLAARRRWLTRGGIGAALGVGVGVWLGIGAPGVGLLLLLLVSASLVTGISRDRAASGSRADRRTAGQVFANGGVAALCGVGGLVGWLPEAGSAIVGAIAAATADTWASEVGRAAGGITWLMTTRERVEPGHPGGVSRAGTAAAAAGALFIGAAGALLLPDAGSATRWLGTAAAAGLAGAMADSLLGATLEERRAGTLNDEINWAGTLAGAAVGWIVWTL